MTSSRTDKTIFKDKDCISTRPHKTNSKTKNKPKTRHDKERGTEQGKGTGKITERQNKMLISINSACGKEDCVKRKKTVLRYFWSPTLYIPLSSCYIVYVRLVCIIICIVALVYQSCYILCNCSCLSVAIQALVALSFKYKITFIFIMLNVGVVLRL